MIKLELTVREAMSLASNCSSDMYDKIVTAFEVALGVNQRRRVTITGGMSTDNRIMCIKSIREHTGWGLKESKDWTDVIVGRYDSYGTTAPTVNFTAYQLGSNYYLSKRTNLYAIFGSTQQSSANASQPSYGANNYAVGVRHTF
jgi:hypothetical protein